MTARDDVLARIRSATGSAHAVSTPRQYRTDVGQEPGSAEVVARFVDRVEDYGARVQLTTADQLESCLAAAVAGEPTAVVPTGLPDAWQTQLAATVGRLRVDDRREPLTAAELDDVAVVVTACRVAIAETGTIVLDGAADQGRRVISLLPDHHVVVVYAAQLVASVPEGIARVDPAGPLTFISGPSATSDIEFQRIQGVHGPRRLDVIVVQADSTGSSCAQSEP